MFSDKALFYVYTVKVPKVICILYVIKISNDVKKISRNAIITYAKAKIHIEKRLLNTYN